MPAPTGITWLDWLIIPGIVATALTTIGLAIHRGARLVRWLYRTARRIEEFLGTWLGDDETPSMPRRIERIETHVGNGHSTPLRHVVDRTAADLHAHLEHAAEQDRTLASLVRQSEKE